MTDDLDRRIAALFDLPPPQPDAEFTARVVALAQYDLAVARARRRSAAQVSHEALGLAAVLASFVLLARNAPDAASLAGQIPLGSPAMLGVAMLLLWGLVATRSQERFTR